MHLDDLALFVRIVELGTLSAAARERNVAVSQITRALARLEGEAGVRLLHRSTHGLSLTDEGDTVLAHARRLLETTAELQAELSTRRAGPSGWVRLSVSTIIGQSLIVPSLPSLYRQHPQLHIDLSADDRIVDMARDGIDIAIRTGPSVEEHLVARRIGRLSRGLYAAPAYAQAHGLPRGVADLEAHRLIGWSASAHPVRWRLADGAREIDYPVRGHSRVDSTAVGLSMVLHGLGIGRIIDLVAEPLVARGELLRVLPEANREPAVPVFAVMLPERQRLPKLRACIDHWADWLAAQCAHAAPEAGPASQDPDG